MDKMTESEQLDLYRKAKAMVFEEEDRREPPDFPQRSIDCLRDIVSARHDLFNELSDHSSADTSGNGVTVPDATDVITVMREQHPTLDDLASRIEPNVALLGRVKEGRDYITALITIITSSYYHGTAVAETHRLNEYISGQESFKKEILSKIEEMKTAMNHLSAQLADLQTVKPKDPAVVRGNRTEEYVQKLAALRCGKRHILMGESAARDFLAHISPHRDLYAELEGMTPEERAVHIKNTVLN